MRKKAVVSVTATAVRDFGRFLLSEAICLGTYSGRH